MKKFILLLVTVAFTLSANAQLELKKGLKVDNTTITNTQIKKIPDIDLKSNKADEVNYNIYVYSKAQTDSIAALKAPKLTAVYKVISDNAQHTAVNTLAETTIFTGTIPANSIGANGSFHIYALLSMVNSANSKLFKVKLNGTQIGAISATTFSSYYATWSIKNRSLTSQLSMIPTSGSSSGYTGHTSAVQTYSLNTAADMTLTVTVTMGVNTETAGIEALEVLAVP
ncbi:MAG: hypothetical protein JZU47_10800 [Prolixibacteraceae bacterium]|nr:hypothetical protein [Prolixibacteraceae bacterium]